MLTIKKGYRVIYEPKAFGREKSSVSIKDEFRRKSRIVAGGFQSMKAMGFLIRKPLILWSFVSHKLLRWILAELLIAVFILNVFLLDNPVYLMFFYLQLLAYALALLGSFINPLSSLFYFVVMQASSLAGLIKFIFGLQKVKWEKARRA
jgi:cellulose synthase/poly-beta-1,6-N-acetylglucosamine synthase-like glycosyltransferase